MGCRQIWILNGIILIMLFPDVIKACHKCECDPDGALSSCQTSQCTPNHVQLVSSTKCSKKGQLCCRMMCNGDNSMCMPDSTPCMEGHTLVPSGTCKRGYKCCQSNSQAMMIKINLK